jgi:transposase
LCFWLTFSPELQPTEHLWTLTTTLVNRPFCHHRRDGKGTGGALWGLAKLP